MLAAKRRPMVLAPLDFQTVGHFSSDGVVMKTRLYTPALKRLAETTVWPIGDQARYIQLVEFLTRDWFARVTPNSNWGIHQGSNRSVWKSCGALTKPTYWRWVANPQCHFPPCFAHFRLVPTLRMHGYCNFTWLTSCFNLCSAHRFSAIRLPRLDMRFFYLHLITIWNTRGVLYLPGRTSVYKPDPKGMWDWGF